jgi:hypothetical protein
MTPMATVCSDRRWERPRRELVPGDLIRPYAATLTDLLLVQLMKRRFMQPTTRKRRRAHE